MSVPFFRVGETVEIAHAPEFPHLVGAECEVIGVLKSRPKYDAYGNRCGQHQAYRILIEGTAMCAPERCLNKRHEPGSWRNCVWQPKREAR